MKIPVYYLIFGYNFKSIICILSMIRSIFVVGLIIQLKQQIVGYNS